MNQYNFHEKVKDGKKGVEIVRKTLKRLCPNGLRQATIDRQDNRKVHYDLDLVFASKNGRLNYKKLEVKTEKREAINVFIETMSSIEHNKIGGFIDTPADYIFHLFLGGETRQKRLLIFPVPAIQRWLAKNRHGYVEYPVGTPTGDTHYTTLGIVVPIVKLTHISLTIDEFFMHAMKLKFSV